MSNIKAIKPSEWCRKMSEKAKDGNAAYDYYQMMQMWESRGL